MKLALLSVALLMLALAVPASAADAKGPLDFKVKSIDQKPVDLNQYKGEVLLVVNVASKCGYTPQYKGLEELWDKYKDQGLVVMGFPCNDFGAQEPGSPSDIQEFCSRTYGVSFPMMAKVQTKAGDGQSEIYQYLGARTGSLPGWNFGKYLIGRDGQPVAFYASGVKPEGDELRTAIEAELKKTAPAAPAAPAKPAPPASPNQ